MLERLFVKYYSSWFYRNIVDLNWFEILIWTIIGLYLLVVCVVLCAGLTILILATVHQQRTLEIWMCIIAFIVLCYTFFKVQAFLQKCKEKARILNNGRERIQEGNAKSCT